MSRNQGSRSWRTKLFLYVVAATGGAAAVGALLGAVGGSVSSSARLALATLTGIVAIGLGAAELLGRPTRPLQCDRETPQRWVHHGPIRWALINGLALGVGAGSRLGFWLWYVVPIGAILTGSLLLGAILYASYGFSRAAAAGLLILGARRKGDMEAVTEWLLSRRPLAGRLAAAQLTLIGASITITAGF